MTGVDLTAAKAAGARAIRPLGSWEMTSPLVRESCETDASAVIDAALPHIREALAKQWTAEFNARGLELESDRLPGNTYSLGVVDGLLIAARIVRGDAS